MLIAICVCTYRRPKGLRRLLEAIEGLEVPTATDLEVVVVDNEAQGRAAEVCAAFTRVDGLRVRCVEEPRRGIPQARNAAVEAALPAADFLAFIDDDEVPEPGWLVELLRVQAERAADVVTGPSLPVFEHEVPVWMVRGRFFESRRRPTGTPLDRAYTDNVLVRCDVFRQVGRFDERLALHGGEDTHFFQRAGRAGFVICWADDAVTRELYPPSRTTVRWLMRRMYRAGTTAAFVNHDLGRGLTPRLVRLGKGLVWLALGAPLILLGWVAGRHRAVHGLRFMAYGTGLLAGLGGVMDAEYRRVHGG
jgi:glycosyltransferase involved in cell wall biosynthesis